MTIGKLLICASAATVVVSANAQAERFGATGSAAVQANVPESKQVVPRKAEAAPAGAPMPTPLPSPKLVGGVDLVNDAIDQIAPLTAEEVKRLRAELQERGEAMRTNATGRAPAAQTFSRYELDLSPNATPPVVRVSPGQGVVVTFEDLNGKPWPVKLGDNFGKRAGVNSSQFTENSLSIDVARDSSMGNIAVALEGLPTPVVFTVVAGQTKTDYWAQMVVPNWVGGKPPAVVAAPLPSFKARELSDYLMRTPPATAKALNVDGLPGVMAWESRPGTMIVRTNALVTSPVSSKLPSMDGMAVYEMPVSPAVMASVNGKFVSIRISGYTVGGLAK